MIRRIQKETEHLLAQSTDSDYPNNEEDDCFREGLVRFFIGMSISYEFHDMVVDQMLNTLEKRSR